MTDTGSPLLGGNLSYRMQCTSNAPDRPSGSLSRHDTDSKPCRTPHVRSRNDSRSAVRPRAFGASEEHGHGRFSVLGPLIGGRGVFVAMHCVVSMKCLAGRGCQILTDPNRNDVGQDRAWLSCRDTVSRIHLLMAALTHEDDPRHGEHDL
jgi:hypothetical protein